MTFGFVPEPPQVFQTHYNITALGITATGTSDLRRFSLVRHNQLKTSSCVANAVAKALEIKRVQKYGEQAHVDLSRLALYYLTREKMGAPYFKQDDGSYISVAASVLKDFGIPREEPISKTDKSYWPFDVSKINIPPSVMAMRSAYLHKISAYYAIHDTGSARTQKVIQALSAGHPVVYGTKVYENFQDYKSGIWSKNSGKILGGHATTIVGWDGTSFIGENSWGPIWGDDGFYRVSPSIIESSESSDFIAMTGAWEQ